MGEVGVCHNYGGAIKRGGDTRELRERNSDEVDVYSGFIAFSSPNNAPASLSSAREAT